MYALGRNVYTQLTWYTYTNKRANYAAHRVSSYSPLGFFLWCVSVNCC